ncbi:hypothetical protein [Actinoplanes couchii]|uniref:Uncharacterized protein n=1 Tax=Actinoplanes couchii TaxID=403638 RepID=A0ABQ3XGC0_9ACTN|nr:hypothetical protein [Actinoplanes couchii]MDR6321002.1 hypothetical protein [Actinoplanes couchii]GID57513.1 hypothetical protein Aco03nite_059170 [Actinoplanes couchii]
MILRVGDVAVGPLPGGGFGACQVSGVDTETITIHALDHVAASPPSLEDLRDAGPARLDHHRSELLAQVSVFREDEAPPPDLDWIGNLPVPAGVPSSVESYARWSWPLSQLAVQRDWDRLPEAARAGYREFPGAERFPAGLSDWSFLDRITWCTEIAWSGPDRGLTAALAAHPLITRLHWDSAPAEVDLRATAIRDLHIHGDGVRSIRLPAGAHTLELDSARARTTDAHDDARARATDAHDDARACTADAHDNVQARVVDAHDSVQVCTVDAHDDGRWLALTLLGATRAPAGLQQVREVSLRGAGVLSASALTGLAAPHTLRLSWSEPPGRLDDPGHLTGLPGLRLITMTGAFGVPAEALPALPLLKLLDVDGVPESVAAALRDRFEGTGVTLVLRGAKGDEWLVAHLDNPFRDWADESVPAGTAACEAYATALRAIDGIGSPGEAEPILRTLVETLNDLDMEYEFIDTIRREEAGDAFSVLAGRAGVPDATAGEWFDEWRDF